MTRSLLGALFLLLAAALSPAQEAGGFLTVRPAGVRVVVDSLAPMVSPVDSLPLHAGRVVLQIFPGRDAAWSEPLLSETLTVAPGEHVVRETAGLAVWRVTSEPFGASVSVRDSVLGTTPLLLSSRMRGKFLRFQKPGYAALYTTLHGGDLHVALQPLPGYAGPSLGGASSRNMTPVYLTAGVSVLAGAGAAYLKIKADGRYADYRRSGASKDLDDVHRLDRLSGISLAASEIALFLLTFQLFSR
jgi:hypothetical protein